MTLNMETRRKALEGAAAGPEDEPATGNDSRNVPGPAAARQQAGARLEELVRVVKASPHGLERRLHALDAAIGNDGAVLRALIGPVRLRRALLDILRAGDTYRGDDYPPARARNGGERKPGNETTGAAGGARRSDTDHGNARASATPRPDPYGAFGRALGNLWWDALRINGQSLAALTVGEARAWATVQGNRAEYVLRLTHGLAPEALIGAVVTRAQAAAVQEQMEREGRHA